MLVVHEWGVMGVGQLTGGPALGALEDYLESLPDFVERYSAPPSPLHLRQFPRHDPNAPTMIYKPVLHCYGAQGQEVSITITAAQGPPAVFYPRPLLSSDRGKNNPNLHWLVVPETMSWELQLRKERPEGLAVPPKGHWWEAAREIPSDYLIMKSGGKAERFLFYEGTTIEKPSVTATVSEEAITIQNSHNSASGPVLLLINDNGTYSGVRLDVLQAGHRVRLDASRIEKWDEKTVLAQCRNQWIDCGMTAEEAEGIVASWRDELLDVPGMLLISQIPDEIYSRIFPIHISPKPSELKRACMIFDTLAGQSERKHWMPKLSAQCEVLSAKLVHGSAEEREEAQGKFLLKGEVVSPYLEEILGRSDVEAAARKATAKIKRLVTTPPICAPAPNPWVYQQKVPRVINSPISPPVRIPVVPTPVPAPK